MNPAEYTRMFENEGHYWWFVSRRELVVDLVQGLHCHGTPLILDMGCGTGATAAALAQLGRVVGLDFSLLALRACTHRGLPELLKSRAEAIPMASECADVIVATDLLEHLDDDLAALREFHRVLKPGGHAVITVPAYSFLWSEHDLALMHKRRYVSRQLGERARGAGLRPIRLGYALSLLFPMALLRLLKRPSRRGPVRLPEAHLPRVPRWLNTVLIRLQRVEAALSRRISLPWGLSVVAVLEKPAA
jgi:SAM-dependent methyltransferase